jgi:hypothetical protein
MENKIVVDLDVYCFGLPHFALLWWMLISRWLLQGWLQSGNGMVNAANDNV